LPSKPLTCLLTGFDAFGTHEVNPSQSLVESFPDILDAGTSGLSSSNSREIHIRKLILPTSGGAAWKKLRQSLDQLSANEETIVIMTGFADTREHLSLERFAINCRDYRIADNSGAQPHDRLVDKLAPDLLRTSVDLIALCATLLKTGYPTEISNHAGTFVCNEIYFRALNYAACHDQIKATIFLHLPKPANFVKSLQKSKDKEVARRASRVKNGGNQIKVMNEAVANIIFNLVKRKFK